MNDNFNDNEVNKGYDPYHFTTPLDPSPIEPEELKSEEIHQEIREEVISESVVTPVVEEPAGKNVDSTYAYTFRKATTREPETISYYKSEDVSKKSKKNKKKTSGFFRKLVACILLAAIFGGVSGGVFLLVAKTGMNILGYEIEKESDDFAIPKVDVGVPSDSDQMPSSPAAVMAGELTVAQVAERCMPAMVAITTTSITEVPNFFGFGSQSYQSTGSGSGIIIDQNEEELLIATNDHVVSGATTLTVCFIDEVLVSGLIKGTDPENDLAVVAVKMTDIPAETREQIKVIQIGDSNEMAVGDQVVAIGNALGYGQSVSSGWVSALNRNVNIENTTLTLIQTDAAINPGNSGGALLNMKGELIGINESKYANTYVEGMGYAIPISTATPILSELISKETRTKVDPAKASYIGVDCKDISSDFATMYNVPVGIYVDSCEENGPAANAGIQKGDIITALDGTKLANSKELIGLLEYYEAGEVVEVTIYRTDDGIYQEMNVMVTLGSRNKTDFLD